MIEITERYVPSPTAAADLLHLALANIVLGYATPEEIESAVETAFLGTDHLWVAQNNHYGRFDQNGLDFDDIYGAQGIVGHRPVILAEHPETGPEVFRLQVDEARLPLFEIHPVKELAIVTTA